jgi:ribosomal protein L37E
VDAPWRTYGRNETIFCAHCGVGIDKTGPATIAKVRRCPSTPLVLPGSTTPKCHRCGKHSEKNTAEVKASTPARVVA